MKNTFLLVFMCLFSWVLNAQISSETTTKNGKKYYLHTVVKGNTLFSICKDYNVSSTEVSSLNPELATGIKEGQKLLIPIVGISAKSFPYTVREGETFFSILKKYNLKEADVLALNPGLDKKLAMEQVIQLPGDYMLNRADGTKMDKVPDTIIQHTVLEHETLYSIAKRFMITVDEVAKLNKVSSASIKPGMVLQVPIYGKEAKGVAIRSIEEVAKATQVDTNKIIPKEKENNYALTFLLPFNTEKQGDPTSAIATEFYMGAQIAIDSLVQMGYGGKVTVLDAGSDTSTLVPIFKQKEVLESNLIIGPLNGENLEYAATVAKNNHIKLVSPIVATTSILKDNPFIYNASTSEVTLAKGLAKYVFKTYPNEQIILVKVGPKDNELYQAFRGTFMGLGQRKLYEVSEKEMTSTVKKGKNCVFVVLSRERVYSTIVANNLMAAATKPNAPLMILFGTKDWLGFEDISGEVKNKLNFHYAASVDFDITSEEVAKLKKLYKAKYNTQLTKYAAQGFDVTMYYVQRLLMEMKTHSGVINNIQLQQTKEGSGYENKACFVFQQDDYKVSKIAEVNE